MRIWIEIHPLTWIIWPLHVSQDGEYGNYFGVGPFTAKWRRG